MVLFENVERFVNLAESGFLNLVGGGAFGNIIA